MKITEHFTLEELTSTQVRGVDNLPNLTQLKELEITATWMEAVRAWLGHPIHINSGFRSPEVNKAVGGSKNSAHCKGWAVDFICPAFGSPAQVAAAILDSDISFDQLIYEGTWVHISFDPQMRRQILTAVFEKGKPTKYISGLQLELS